MKRALVLLLVLVVGLAACGRKKVVTQPDLPPLAPSPPPARVIAPPPPEPEPPPPATEPVGPARGPSKRPQQKPEPPREPAKPEPPKPVQLPPPEEPQSQTLQTTPPGGQAEAMAQATKLLEQARRDLRSVPYKALNADRKSQYDSANRFIEQAQQALKEENFVFALRLADKAATLAAGLAGR